MSNKRAIIDSSYVISTIKTHIIFIQRLRAHDFDLRRSFKKDNSRNAAHSSSFSPSDSIFPHQWSTRLLHSRKFNMSASSRNKFTVGGTRRRKYVSTYTTTRIRTSTYYRSMLLNTKRNDTKPYNTHYGNVIITVKQNMHTTARKHTSYGHTSHYYYINHQYYTWSINLALLHKLIA